MLQLSLKVLPMIAFLACRLALAQVSPPRFTVEDDIAFSHFGDPYSGEIDPITYSADHRYFVVATERGLLETDRSEATLRIFRTQDIRELAKLPPPHSGAPKPLWIIRRATYKDASVISQIHWLADSKSFGFLLRLSSGNHQLYLANLRTRTTTALTPENRDVTVFDIRDAQHFAYAVLSPDIWKKAEEEAKAAAVVGTGRALTDMIFTADKYPQWMQRWNNLSDVWSVADGRRSMLKDTNTGRPVQIYWEGLQSFRLAPDGRTLETILPLGTVPGTWPELYPPPYSASPYRVRAGLQDLSAFEGSQYISQFMSFNLRTGQGKALTGAPTGHSAGWWHLLRAEWSPHGNRIMVANTFVRSSNATPARATPRPCLAVVDLESDDAQCLMALKGRTDSGYEENYERIDDFHFTDQAGDHATVTFSSRSEAKRTASYERLAGGKWTSVSSMPVPIREEDEPKVEIEQSLNDPPVLVASWPSSGVSRVLLDPNPQLKAIDLGRASVFQWSDDTGRQWEAGLYTPADFDRNKRYPLVIQTHGFAKSDFEPSGIYPTALAARELAAAGIVILQMPMCDIRATAEEGDCNNRLYKSALDQLLSQGWLDADRVGIIGFSRTCYYVLSALTVNKLHFRAASITDGINYGYFEYLSSVGILQGGLTREAEKTYGGSPFGRGIGPWLSHAPLFNMDKVSTPMLVVANGRCTLIEMWEPYATLRLQHKPVDLIVLRGGTHVLTSPQERLASQGGTVDWFRFWLQGFIDPNPAKAAQYSRWQAMQHGHGTASTY